MGSNSFAGRCVTYALAKTGFEVIGISRSHQIHKNFDFGGNLSQYNNQSFKFLKIDINRDIRGLVNLLEDFSPELIFDLAGEGLVAESWINPEQWFQTNLMAKIPLFNKVVKMKTCEKYIRFSTPEVYGSNQSPVTENQRLNPTTPYAVSHSAIDQFALAYEKEYGFPIVLARYANFYGSHQQLYRIVPKTIASIIGGRKLSLHGGGISERTFIHKIDIVESVLSLINHAQPGETYHFAGEELISIRTLVNRICGLMGVEIMEHIEEVEERPGKDFRYHLSLSKSRNELDWGPKVNLDEGLLETITWFLANKGILLENA